MGILMLIVGLIAIVPGILTNDKSLVLIGHVWIVGSIVVNTV